MDFERYQNLHTIIMLKDILRKWWGVELSFADRNGAILDHAGGEIVPPQNDFCRLSLFSKEGYRRCSQSWRVLIDKFKSSSKVRHVVFHDCHLGFLVAGVPVYVEGELQGALIVEGFKRQAPSSREASVLKQKIGEVNPGATDLDRALDRIPILDERSIDHLVDLLTFAANDIGAFELAIAKKEGQVNKLSAELNERYRFENIVGKSGPMLEVFRLLEKVCASDSTVLIQGESGTGKELVARAIHYNGPRHDKPFVVQNCSAFNDNLLESALFGHLKGSFTGAVRDKKGLFEIADQGTFFLDEVGDMSPALQVKLLRVLQEGSFIPVGSNVNRQVDVRVIAATHKDLGELVKRGEFREDLYYRINVIKVTVPPLRDRRDDIPVLIEHFLRRHAKHRGSTRQLSRAALDKLCAYAWPGNIRELENEIERLVVLSSDGETVEPELLSSRIREAGGDGSAAAGIDLSGQLGTAVEALEREMIHQGLVRTRFNKSRLARELGISRSNLILKIERYKLDSPPKT